MLSGGALRLASLYSVLPGQRAVVATTSDRGIEIRVADNGPGLPEGFGDRWAAAANQLSAALGAA